MYLRKRRKYPSSRPHQSRWARQYIFCPLLSCKIRTSNSIIHICTCNLYLFRITLFVTRCRILFACANAVLPSPLNHRESVFGISAGEAVTILPTKSRTACIGPSEILIKSYNVTRLGCQIGSFDNSLKMRLCYPVMFRNNNHMFLILESDASSYPSDLALFGNMTSASLEHTFLTALNSQRS